MKVRAIDFVVLNVSDMEGAVRFYRDTLGMDFPFSPVGSEHWKELDSPPVALALRRDAAARGQMAVALAVEDVGAAVEELRAKGVPILVEPSESETCYSALIQAPDGNVLVLHRRKDGTAG